MTARVHARTLTPALARTQIALETFLDAEESREWLPEHAALYTLSRRLPGVPPPVGQVYMYMRGCMDGWMHACMFTHTHTHTHTHRRTFRQSPQTAALAIWNGCADLMDSV